MIKETQSSETSVVIIATGRHIPEDGILHSHCSDNLKLQSVLTMLYDTQNDFPFYFSLINACLSLRSIEDKQIQFHKRCVLSSL
jgi:hypothetical protein